MLHGSNGVGAGVGGLGGHGGYNGVHGGLPARNTGLMGQGQGGLGQGLGQGGMGQGMGMGMGMGGQGGMMLECTTPCVVPGCTQPGMFQCACLSVRYCGEIHQR
jgi:hypothetical protein